jgi:hypothetical protein
MVNLEQLRDRGLWAYETGRMRMASRVALLLIPLAVVCLLEARGREACACLSVSLLGVAVWLRWRDRRGSDAVTTGLLAGSIPLVAGLVLARLGLRCGAGGSSSFCLGLSVLVGLGAGALIAVREATLRHRAWSWVTAGLVATLAASLGCVRLGIIGFGGVVLGMAVGTAAASRIATRPR